ncbi:MAG: 50S ribosomal protein L22 [Bacteroidetes bacterium]|nr:50S ribosomal protein L22 [Bacteroidota bacterium]MCY4233884.1 50S ribosomal protein L22 [Bacteroidota bacterium]
MQARAVRKYIPGSPRKIRRVVNVVRGKSVAEAINVLNYLPQAATRPVELAIRSAMHNLTDQNRSERLDDEDVFVKEIRVDQGPSLKRIRPMSRGRAHPIRKRMSHITVIVQSEKA